MKVVARAVAEGLPRRGERLVGGEHHDLDARVELLEMAQQLRAGHAGHADVQHGGVHAAALRDLQRLGAAAGEDQIVKILEDNAERLPRPFLVVHDKERRARRGGFRNEGRPQR